VETTKSMIGGAAEAIGDIGTTAVDSARDILMSVVGGVKDVASAALPRRSVPPEERPAPERPVPEYRPAPEDRTPPP
jgi:hypothetical protein